MSVEREHLDTLAEIAYGAYRAMKSDDNAPGFDVQPLRERRAWRAVADAVRMWEHLHRPDNPARTRAVMSADTRIERTHGYPSADRTLDPPFQTRAGDAIGLGEGVFRAWRDGVLVADYRDDGSGVLRPVPIEVVP